MTNSFLRLHTASVEPAQSLTELMLEIQAGSHRALQTLMDQYWPELVRYAFRESYDIDLARDVVQQAFIHVWEHRHSWQRGAPRAYLYRIVRSQLTDEWRRKIVRANWLRREQLRSPGQPSTPADVLDGEIATATYERALAALPHRRREAFNLVVLRGLSHREAAEVLDISQQTVANHVTAALSEIRSALDQV